MASTVCSTRLPPIGPSERHEVGKSLQATLVEQQLWMVRAQLPAAGS
jgi:hypothetical protein